MQIKFHENHSLDESVERLTNVLNLFKEKYGICDFRDIQLSLTLVNGKGDDVEIIDSTTSEVCDTFKIYKTNCKLSPPKLRLAVDNSKFF